MAKSLLTISLVLVVSTTLMFITGCESDAQTGAGIGALAGAGIGQLAGGDTKSTLIGAAVGGGAGYMIGNEQDKKKQKADIDSLRDDMNTVTVNITNSNGSISQVSLRKQGTVYIGPRGETYTSLPTEDQLRPVYGF
jgi:hypothetical protein